MSDLGTDNSHDSRSLFTDTRLEQKRNTSPPNSLVCFSPLRYSTNLLLKATLRQECSTGPDVSGNGQNVNWCRNFNLLPFRFLLLGGTLGPTNPRLMNIVEEPWPLRRMGFSPIYATTISMIIIRTRSTGPHGPTSTRARRLSTASPFGGPKYR